MRRQGCVYLVGAGPGPLDLLTVRARRVIRKADVLAFDELVHPALLQLAPAHCEILAIGYRAGQTKDRPPPLHPLVLQKAQEGKRVVRLKAGDPMIFARGGEEAMALAAAGIPYHFVPGITAALAAASSCHLPLTWRGQSAELRLTTTSQPAPRKTDCAATIALYMPRHGISAYVEDLIQKGWSPHTPAAFVMAAAQKREICVRSTLQSLADEVAMHPSDRPGLVLIGDSLRMPHMAKAKPLALVGLHVLLARAHSDPSKIARALSALGADVWESPWIGVQALGRSSACLRQTLAQHKVLLIPSAALWKAFLQQLKAYALDLRSLVPLRLVAAGEATAAAMRATHVHPDLTLPSLTLWQQHRQTLADEQGLAPQPALQLCYAGELNVHRAEHPSPHVLWACAETTVQYPRLPAARPDLLIVPHHKALDRLLEGPAQCESLRALPVICFGESLRERLVTEQWDPSHIRVVRNLDQLLKLLKEPQSEPDEETTYEPERTFDPLHGAWQG